MHFETSMLKITRVWKRTWNHCKLPDMQNLLWRSPQTHKRQKEAIDQFHYYFWLPWKDKHEYYHRRPLAKAPLHWLIHMHHRLSHFPHSVNYMILLSVRYLELIFEDSVCIFSENKLKNCIQQVNMVHNINN